DTVRVIKFGESIELCGGTHVSNTGSIGLFIITSESAVAAGVRRIEAITSERAEAYYKQKSQLLDQVSLALKNPKDLMKAVSDLQVRNQQLQKEIEAFQKERAKSVKNELKAKVTESNGVHILSAIVDLDAGGVKDILFQLKGEYPNFIGIMGGKSDDKCSLSMIITESLANEKGLNAGQLIKEASPLIKGGGGGQPFFATAGGKDANGLDAAIQLIKEKI
ncbi:MAG: alanine--tRNA ligase, partial [Bacteroidetes bacterium]